MDLKKKKEQDLPDGKIWQIIKSGAWWYNTIVIPMDSVFIFL